MRPVLRLLGSRYGLAALLILVVLVIVTVTRAVFPSPATVMGAALPGGRATVNPTAGDDGVAGSGAATGAAPASGTAPSATVTGPDPVPVATAFLRAWLHHTGVTQQAWYAGITPYLTAALAGKLKATDPADVPASRMTGPATVTARDPTYAEVSVPVDAGTIVLRLKLAATGRWQVDGVDWNRP